MSPSLLAGALVVVFSAPAPEPAAGPPPPRPPWVVCLVAGEPIPGAGVAEVGDALAVEARKRERAVRVAIAPAVDGCQ
ncbi:MAG: hypothetical protein CVU56_26140, partial [Deltaproteobacteria bacterium HGW-Deltaproteobacteria-14]